MEGLSGENVKFGEGLFAFAQPTFSPERNLYYQNSVTPHRRDVVDYRALCCEQVAITDDPHT